MSRRVATGIPLIDRQCIIETLNNLKYSYKLFNDNIIIPSLGHGGTELVYEKTHFKLIAYEHDIDHIKEVLNNEYNRVLNEKIKLIEAEKKRIEEERKLYIENQKQAIVQKAKKMGYSVKESIENEKVTLVLVKRIY